MTKLDKVLSHLQGASLVVIVDVRRRLSEHGSPIERRPPMLTDSRLTHVDDAPRWTPQVPQWLAEQRFAAALRHQAQLTETQAVLYLDEVRPRMFSKRHPDRLTLADLPFGFTRVADAVVRIEPAGFMRFLKCRTGRQRLVCYERPGRPRRDGRSMALHDFREGSVFEDLAQYFVRLHNEVTLAIKLPAHLLGDQPVITAQQRPTRTGTTPGGQAFKFSTPILSRLGSAG